MAETILAAIDPGANTGAAFFGNGVLYAAELHTKPVAHLYLVNQLVIEIPKFSDQTKGKDPQDLITLAVNAGQWIQVLRAPDVRRVFPSQWKGNVPKAIHNERVLAKLTPAELAVIPKLPATKLHNVIDAIGLGLFALGRMGRGA